MSSQARADLNQLPVKTQFWRYVLPSVAGMLVVSLDVLIDGIFVGRYVGAHALAAINLVYPIVMLQIGLGTMVSMGAATRISILQGAGQTAAARANLGQYADYYCPAGYCSTRYWYQPVGADTGATECR
ncbi:MATE family efflux transporter [Deefgea sp. CFH1-16]|uniref:MATE family efflux transporter n=1 Tax=Deefgea sp. CFH1-16 TaxID=2675457 RepID=UPI0015F6868F|nr:MATE family efflux transporter [Deefgea sp. CFH1-16]MBM5574262.1 hypothetical protein [Deefgea sp. CFH1-16]